MKLRIRTMRETDLPAVAALEKEIFPDPWSLAAFEESTSYAACGGLVAERLVPQRTTAEGEIVGYACYYHAGGETHLTNIAVSPRHRRKRVARKLLDAIFALARTAESDAVFLEVRASNKPAQELYRQYNFRELYRRRGYYKEPKEDAIVYVCELTDAPTEPSDNEEEHDTHGMV